jgi:hypothetical protein
MRTSFVAHATYGVVVDEARLNEAVAFLDRVPVAVLGDFAEGALVEFDP